MPLTDKQREEAALHCPETLKFYDQGIAAFKSTEEDILKKIEDFKIRAANENAKNAKPEKVVDEATTDEAAEDHPSHHKHGKKDHPA